MTNQANNQDHTHQPRMRQLIDWDAAGWGGVIASIVSLVLAMLFFGPTGLLRALAIPFLGNNIPDGLSLITVITSVGVHLWLSLVFAFLIAFLIHRGGFVAGVIGGGLIGLALFAINFYAVRAFAPNLIGSNLDGATLLLQDWRMGLTHVVFGAVAGGIYEWLEVEEFVPA